jgi:alcohol dehydrogenase
VNAVAFYEHGGPEVLHFGPYPTPEPRPGEALVRVGAVALNRLDIFVRQGMPGVRTPLPHITGGDVAGTVEALGPGAHGFGPGDRVLVDPAFGCGRCEYCVAGEVPRCLHGATLGEEVDGGLAEYVRVPAANLLPLPERLDMVEAASLPIAYGTAWRMLLTRGGLRPMETVYIVGSGGVSVAALQIARMAGARVIISVGDDEKAAKAEALGADLVFNHRKADAVKTVREFTRKRGADVVVDSVGRATWAQSQVCLGKGGRLVTCGATTGFDLASDARYLFWREQSLIGSNGWTRGELTALLAAVGRGAVKAVVERVYALADAARAERDLEARGAFGKLVLVP